MKKASTARTWIWRILRPDMGMILVLSVISALIAGGMVLFALLSRQVIDRATGAVEGDLWLPGGGLLLLVAVEALLHVLFNDLKTRVSGRVDIRIKDTVFNALFHKRWQDVHAYHSGELLNRMTGDSHVVVTGVATLIPQVVSISTRLIACLVVLLTMDWRFTLALMGVGLLMLLSTRLYGRKMKALHKDCQQADGQAKSFAQESLANWMMIQSFEGGTTVRQHLGGLLNRQFKANLKRTHWSNLAHAGLYLLFSGSYYVALLWGALRLAAGGLTFGALTAFLQIVSQIRTPFMNLSGILTQYYNMLASAERIMELQQLPEEPREPQTYEAGELYSRLQSLEADGLHFAYDPETVVLEGAQLSVPKGQFVALAGFSGIGKSTLFKLLLGFHTPDSGRLTARLTDGVVPLGADTRCLFAYVPQQNMLLSGSVRDNIAFCCGDVTDAAVWAAAETACVADAIRALPQGLDTVLGERGAGLSEGQLQRLAIARAVLSGAPILLLDEATSSLDEATEAQVLINLRALPERTCLCISHRPAALEICDRVIRLEDGRFVEE
ncbi:MAG: ABC transporter ATP-binding protein [Clostridia bacterium]|nr:ABC transporter ATP-binding protein [Clostridia bacterium]